MEQRLLREEMSRDIKNKMEKAMAKTGRGERFINI
jgi:hypothetical protein